MHEVFIFNSKYIVLQVDWCQTYFPVSTESPQHQFTTSDLPFGSSEPGPHITKLKPRSFIDIKAMTSYFPHCHSILHMLCFISTTLRSLRRRSKFAMGLSLTAMRKTDVSNTGLLNSGSAETVADTSPPLMMGLLGVKRH